MPHFRDAHQALLKDLRRVGPTFLTNIDMTAEERDELVITPRALQADEVPFIGVAHSADQFKVHYNPTLYGQLRSQKDVAVVRRSLAHELYHTLQDRRADKAGRQAQRAAWRKAYNRVSAVQNYLGVAGLAAMPLALNYTVQSVGYAFHHQGAAPLSPLGIAALGVGAGIAALRTATRTFRREENAANHMANMLSSVTQREADDWHREKLRDAMAAKHPFMKRDPQVPDVQYAPGVFARFASNALHALFDYVHPLPYQRDRQEKQDRAKGVTPVVT